MNLGLQVDQSEISSEGVVVRGNSPISGVVSVMGSMSPTMEEKMVMANIIVTPQITLR